MPKPKYQPFDWKAPSVLPSDHNAPDAHMDDLIFSLNFDTTSRPSKRFKPSSSEIVHLPPSGKPTIDLPIEIILNIVEQMGWDSISIGKFMRTSKASANTILYHEASLCLSFVADVPHDNKPILSSAPTFSPCAPGQRTSAVQSALKRVIASHFPTYLPFSRFETVTGPTLEAFRSAFYRTFTLLHPTTALPGLKEIETSYHNAYIDWGRGTGSGLVLGWRDSPSFLGAGNGRGRPARFETLPKVARALRINSFEWIEELHLRERIKSFLPKSRLLDCKYEDPRTRAIYLTAQSIDDRCEEGIDIFKVKGVEVLYQMWDARISSVPAPSTQARCDSNACESPSECQARNNIERWIMAQSETTLAALLQIVWIASQLYEPPSLRPREREGRCEHGGHDVLSTLDNGLTHGQAERASQWEVVERQCIFRELCFESGPWFMYACRVLGPRAPAREKEEGGWALERLDKGVSRLHAYESGAPLEEEQAASDSDAMTGLPDTAEQPQIPRMTLQATLLNRFCELRECDLRHGWDEVFFVNAVEIATTQQESDEKRAAVKRAKELEQRELEKQWKEMNGGTMVDKKGKPVWAAIAKAALKGQPGDASWWGS